VVAACTNAGNDEAVEAAARKAEREVISLAQASAAQVEVFEARYRCDASDAAGGDLAADSDGAAPAPEIMRSLEAHAKESGWGVERQGEALVLRKVIDGRKFFAVAPGSGSKVEPQSDRLVVAWNLDRDSC
jgi:hypothetical protein